MRNPLVKLVSLAYNEFDPGRTFYVWMFFLFVLLLLGCGAGDTTTSLVSLSNPIHIVVETNTGGATALVLEQGSGIISRIDLDTLVITETLITGLNHPEGFAIESNGNSVLIIENASPVRLVRGNLSTKNTSIVCPSLSLNSPSGIVLENSGDVLVTENLRLSRVHFNPQGNCTVTPLNSNLNTPTGIALDQATNSVLVTDSSDGKLIRIPLNNDPPETLAFNLLSPSGVAILSAGGALVVQTGNGSVLKIAGSQLPSPSTIVTTVKTGLNNPRGIALNSQENTAFVTETNPGQIVQISIPFP